MGASQCWFIYLIIYLIYKIGRYLMKTFDGKMKIQVSLVEQAVVDQGVGLRSL